VEADHGPGHVVVSAVSPTLVGARWPLHPSFVPLVQELFLAALEGQASSRTKTVGEPLVLNIRGQLDGVPMVQVPDGSWTAADPVSEEQRGVAIRFTGARAQGLYRFRAPGAPDECFVVNPAVPDEAAPRRLGEAELHAILPGAEFTYQTSLRLPAWRSNLGTAEPSWWCLLTAGILLFTEMALARRREAE
jgi:hypothetical protein